MIDVNRWQASIIGLMHLRINICKQPTLSNIYRIVKNFGRKNFGMHRECYENSENVEKNFVNCCNLPNSPKVFITNFSTVWYCIYDQPKVTNYIVILMFNGQ